MIVNLSPTVSSSNESLCSLRFASQVSQCELGKPKPKKTILNNNNPNGEDVDMSDSSSNGNSNISVPATPSRPQTAMSNNNGTAAAGGAKKLTASKLGSSASVSKIGSIRR
jgi:hypothetical protein